MATEFNYVSTPGVTEGGTATAASPGGILTILAGIGLIKLFIGMNRIAPDQTVDVGGKPAMAQISFGAAIKNMFSVVTGPSVAVAVGAVLVVKNLVKKTLSTVTLANNSGDAALSVAVENPTRYNPLASVLTSAINTCITYSTATSATVYMSAFTATSTTGTTWWNFQTAMASTATGSHQSVLYTAKYFTDVLSGVTPATSTLSLDDILGAMKDNEGGAPVEGMIVPSVETMAGTLAYPAYITSATSVLFSIIEHANTSTTSNELLLNDIAVFEGYKTQLVTRINTDATNQATYMSQANHLSVIDNAAKLLNNVRDNHTGDVFELYKATLNPELLGAIQGVAALKDLNSSNTATVAAAVAAFEAGVHG